MHELAMMIAHAILCQVFIGKIHTAQVHTVTRRPRALTDGKMIERVAMKS